MNTILISLKPFFQEYDISKLTPEKDSHTIIERVLQFGNRAEIKWLFNSYPKKRLLIGLKNLARINSHSHILIFDKLYWKLANEYFVLEYNLR